MNTSHSGDYENPVRPGQADKDNKESRRRRLVECGFNSAAAIDLSAGTSLSVARRYVTESEQPGPARPILG